MEQMDHTLDPCSAAPDKPGGSVPEDELQEKQVWCGISAPHMCL